MRRIGPAIAAPAPDPANADAYNLLGHGYRKPGNVEKAFEHGRAALSFDAGHRGANEYIGAPCAALGELAKAEAQLVVLDKARDFGRAEYTELEAAIMACKARQGA